MIAARLLLIAAAALMPAAAFAKDCSAAIERVGTSYPQAEYDPFNSNPTVVPFAVGISNKSKEACAVILTLHGLPGARFLRSLAKIEYTVTGSTGQVIRNDSASQYGLVVQLAGDQRTTIPLAVRIAPGQVVSAGRYADLVSMSLFSSSGKQLDEGELLPAEVDVPSRAQINIAGADTSFGKGAAVRSIDLGDLVSGASRKVYMQLRSNSGARVQLQSENGGRLVNPALGADAKIPYSITVDGVVIDLGAGPAQLKRRPPQTIDGVSYGMTVQVGGFGQRFAGLYKDRIVITVEPAE